MPRRGQVIQRVPLPDAKYGNTALARFINRVMRWGKKLTAQRIVYTSLDIIQRTAKRDPIEVFEQALRNAKPLLEVKPRRVGGATYQVPIEVRAERADALAQRWLIQFARSRAGKSMAERLAAELLDAYHGTGGAVKKREDTHRMAEANKAFAHYRW